MKSLLQLLLLLFVLQPLMAQTTEPHIHDRYCRHYPEQAETPAYAYRNDWQSDLVHNYDVTFYFLDIAVSSTSIQVGGTVEIHATVVADDFDVFAFELNASLSLDNITFNDVAVENWTWEGDNVLAEVPTLQAGDTFVAKIEYGGTLLLGGDSSRVLLTIIQIPGRKMLPGRFQNHLLPKIGGQTNRF